MSDLRDAVAKLAEAIDLLTNDAGLMGYDAAEIRALAQGARDIAMTVNGVAGQSVDA